MAGVAAPERIRTGQADRGQATQCLPERTLVFVVSRTAGFLSEEPRRDPQSR